MRRRLHKIGLVHQKGGRLGVALVCRIIGWILLISGLPVFATDALLWFESGQWVPLSGLELWHDLAPSTVKQARAIIETALNPLLWDPTLVTMLAIPAFLLLMSVGVLLMLFFLEDSDSAPKVERVAAKIVLRITRGIVLIGMLPVLAVAQLGRKTAWVLLGGAVVIFTADAVSWINAGRYEPLSALDVWHALAPSSIHWVRVTIEIYLHPVLWDPVLVTLLSLPLFWVLGSSGVFALVCLGRRPKSAPEIKKRKAGPPLFETATARVAVLPYQ